MSAPDETLHDVLEAIPIEYRERFASAAEAPRPVTELVDELDGYVDTVRKVASWVTALDPDVAAKIATVCKNLVDRFGAGPHEVLVRATLTYFLEEDEDDEVTGILGFDDDLQVVNAVCRTLGAEDLVLPLSR